MCIMTQVLQGKGDFRTLFHVPTFQNAYKSYRVSFLGESRNAQSPVRGKFRCRAITHTVFTTNVCM